MLQRDIIAAEGQKRFPQELSNPVYQVFKNGVLLPRNSFSHREIYGVEYFPENNWGSEINEGDRISILSKF